MFNVEKEQECWCFVDNYQDVKKIAQIAYNHKLRNDLWPGSAPLNFQLTAENGVFSFTDSYSTYKVGPKVSVEEFLRRIEMKEVFIARPSQVVVDFLVSLAKKNNYQVEYQVNDCNYLAFADKTLSAYMQNPAHYGFKQVTLEEFIEVFSTENDSIIIDDEHEVEFLYNRVKIGCQEIHNDVVKKVVDLVNNPLVTLDDVTINIDYENSIVTTEEGYRLSFDDVEKIGERLNKE